MDRYTKKDVETAFALLCETAEKVGIKKPTDKWVLQIGSRMNGNAYRLFAVDLPGTGLRALGFTNSNGYLGMTAREAWQVLGHYNRAWLAVLAVRDDAGETGR